MAAKLNAAITAVNLAENLLGSISPLQLALRAVKILLTKLRDETIDEEEYAELELECADICRAIDRVVKGNTLDHLSQPVRDAVNQFIATLEELQKAIEQNPASRFSRRAKEIIASWRSDPGGILRAFNSRDGDKSPKAKL